jgi:hypothetical protein
VTNLYKPQGLFHHGHFRPVDYVHHRCRAMCLGRDRAMDIPPRIATSVVAWWLISAQNSANHVLAIAGKCGISHFNVSTRSVSYCVVLYYMLSSIVLYTHYPLQHILTNLHLLFDPEFYLFKQLTSNKVSYIVSISFPYIPTCPYPILPSLAHFRVARLTLQN